MNPREATARVELDQRHPGHFQRWVVGPHGCWHRFVPGGAMRIERPRAAPIPKHERAGLDLFERVFDLSCSSI